MEQTPNPRRVVTGISGGKSVVISDGPPANLHAYAGWPGHLTSIVWATSSMPVIPPKPGVEPAPARMPVLPAPGETRMMIVHLPPDTIFADPRFDPVRLDRELTAHLNGLHQCFEPESPGMHATDSLDYDIVIDGEIWLELDDGAEVHLRRGDIVVQGGGRHAWRNRSAKVAIMAFILIGARRNA